MTASKNKYLSDDHQDFTVENRDSIVHLLRGMVRKDVVLSGAFNGGRDVLLTAVLAVDADSGIVYLDVNANEERNQLIRQTKRIVFFANFDGAKVQWASAAVEDGVFEGRQAFRVGIPERLQRIQRRSSYRVNTPVTSPVMCRIPLGAGEVALRLVDISVDGIGVILPDEADEAVQKNAEFKNCVIEHPDLGAVTAALAVQSIWEVDLRNGTKSRRAGLQFLDIHGTAQAKIQRFVYKMERLLLDMSNEE